MGQKSDTLVVRWQGKFCGRWGNNGRPVAGGCDYHYQSDDYQACCRFTAQQTVIGPGNLFSHPIQLELDDSNHASRCNACVKEYGE